VGPTLVPFSDPVVLIVSAFAVYRLTRLVVADSIFEPLRRPLLAREGRGALFITCPWCVSVWLAGGWALLVWLLPTAALVAGAVLAWSAAAGLLSSWE
jgi:hypothetical protein